MRIFLVLNIIISIFLKEARTVFVEGKNVSVYSNSCFKDQDVVICDLKQGENKIDVEVSGDCQKPYWAVMFTWEDEGAMKSELVELKKKCILMFPIIFNGSHN